jgi:hypothetical protein
MPVRGDHGEVDARELSQEAREQVA